jgi:hypothetical protein
MVNAYNVNVFTIWKYVEIMCEILADKDKIYKIFIHLLTIQRLLFVIEKFRVLTSIQQTASVIDGTHFLILAIQQDYSYPMRFLQPQMFFPHGCVRCLRCK